MNSLQNLSAQERRVDQGHSQRMVGKSTTWLLDNSIAFYSDHKGVRWAIIWAGKVSATKDMVDMDHMAKRTAPCQIY
jgi:hypothetical protein